MVLGRPENGNATFLDLVAQEDRIINYICDNCQGRRTTARTVRTLLFPDDCKHLIVSLPIFIGANNKKSEASITGFNHSSVSFGDETRWAVKAAICFSGTSPNAGHYTCMVKYQNRLVVISDVNLSDRKRFFGSMKSIRMLMLSRVE